MQVHHCCRDTMEDELEDSFKGYERKIELESPGNVSKRICYHFIGRWTITQREEMTKKEPDV